MEQQVPVSQRLRLPDVRQLVDEQPGTQDGNLRKILAVGVAQGVEVQVPARRHRYSARLEWEELLPPDRDPGIVDRAAEHGSRQRDLAFCQPALSPDGAGKSAGLVQRSSPAARISAGKVDFLPFE